MIKKSLLILSIIAVLVLAGCNNNSGDTPTSSTFHGGTSGIISSFEPMGMEENGVQTVWVAKDFPVEVTVKNKGEETISPGRLKVTLQGVDTALFHIPNSVMTNVRELEKISETNEIGGEETIDFGDARLDSITGLFYDANFFATVEYDYKTYAAVPQVCFKYNYQDTSLCELTGAKTVFSSGAPVQVKTVTQDSGGSRKIALLFEVENVGGGHVAPPGQPFSNLYDKLQFQIAEGSTGDITFECESAGDPSIARFNDGKATIRCRSSELPDGTLYTKQVTLELSYVYKSILQQTVRIRNEN